MSWKNIERSEWVITRPREPVQLPSGDLCPHEPSSGESQSPPSTDLPTDHQASIAEPDSPAEEEFIADDDEVELIPTATIETTEPFDLPSSESSSPDVFVRDGRGQIRSTSGISPEEATSETDYANGELIVEVPVYSGKYCYESVDFVENCDVPYPLTIRGVQVSADDYRKLFGDVTGHFFVNCHCCFSYVWLLACLAAIVVLFLSGWFVCRDTLHHSADLCAVTVTPLAVVCVFVAFLVCTVGCHRYSRRFVRAMHTANELMRDYNVLVAGRDYGCSACDRMSVLFYYYKWPHCQLHLQQFLEKNPHLRSSSNHQGHEQQNAGDSETTPLLAGSGRGDNEALSLSPQVRLQLDATSIESEAAKLLSWHAVEYGKLLAKNRLAPPSEDRHIGQGECLCQFVEAVLCDPTNYGCVRRTCHRGVKSRRPWKNCLCYY